MYDRHEVSVKVALYSSDGKRTLLMRHWGDAGFGLPGGHIDAGEMPDEALERELREELGITIDATPADFYVRDPYDTIKSSLAIQPQLTVILSCRTRPVMVAKQVPSG